tara:strand:+ start:91 stop:252 length:162 start_codon:yes stop_codon:yes gene_type:complete
MPDMLLKLHGSDLSRLHAASLFYLPCKTKNQEYNFFINTSVKTMTSKFLGENK